MAFKEPKLSDLKIYTDKELKFTAISIALAGICCLFLSPPFKLFGVFLIVFSFFTKSYVRKVEKSQRNRLLNKYLNSKSPFPDLKEVELSIATSLANQSSEVNVNLENIDLTPEKISYLKKQYGVSVPVAHPNHPDHNHYKVLFEKIETEILNGKKFSFLPNDLNAFQSFVDRKYPGTIIKNEDPVVVEFYAAGLNYYEYEDYSVQDLLDHNSGELTFEMEPENKYDAQAVSIFLDGYKLGHVPRPLNKKVFYALKYKRFIKSQVMGHFKNSSIENRLLIETVIFK